MPRPKLNPTNEQRLLVKSLAAFGVPQEQIGRKLGIRSPKTLRKYFRAELDSGALEANTNVSNTLYQMATSGQCPAATIFWLKNRAGWADRPATGVLALPPPPFVVAREQGVQQP